MDGAFSDWIDTNDDGVADSGIIDVNGDGATDLQYTDLNGDGVAEVLLVDVNADGATDYQVTDLGGGVGDVLVDSDADGVADGEYLVAPFPTYPTADYLTASAPIFDPATTGAAWTDPAAGATGPFASSETASLVSSINAQMADASTVYHSALDPNSVSADDLSAAEQRISNSARNAQSMAGYTYQQEVSNSVYQGDLQRQWADTASEEATSTWIDAQRAIDRADQAVWDSERSS